MPDGQNITKLSEEHKFFVLEEKQIKPNFFALWHRHQVSMGEVWILYQDGVYYDKLEPGRHTWFHGFLHDWKYQRINQNIELIHITVDGRVRGPALNRGNKTIDEDEEENMEIRLAGMDEFACEVTTTLGLSCGITRFETFLHYRDPLSVFLAAVKNMVHEIISTLPYDQYGHWATLLRDNVKQRLQFTQSAEDLIGMRVQDVFVTEIQPNSRHDRNMLEMYQQVERARRELVAAKDNRKSARIIAESHAEQGEILNIAPSILALQDSPIGRALIERDADLKKLMIAAGLNPGVSIQAIPDPQQSLQERADAQSIGYLRPAKNAGLLPTNSTQGSFAPATPPQGAITGTFFTSNNQSNTSPFSAQTLPQPPRAVQSESGIDPARIEQELTALQTANFTYAGKGHFDPTYDDRGQVIPGSKEWVLDVYAIHASGYLTLVFHCAMSYPMTPPRVQMRTPSDSRLQWVESHTVRNWNSGTLLVHIAQELNATVQ